MTDETVHDKVERLVKNRSRALPVLLIIYLTQQLSFCSALGAGEAGSAYGVKIAAWASLSLALLLTLATKGFWFQPKAVRDLVDDENTRANRLEGMRLGFVVAIVTAIACYFIDRVEPLATGETVHAILTLGLGAALMRFAMLERRALRDD